MATTDNTLHLAVTMAGAVSAGSYTGGVMDYLLEALEAWERAKGSTDPTVPTHHVRIDLLNGTSAGGMTAIIAGVALQSTIDPVSPGNEAAKTTNKLYRSWVELTGDDNILPMMLKNDDIKEDRVPSLLNSTFIEKIANQIVTETTGPLPLRPYIAPELEVMVTLSNLLGLQYKVFFGPDEKDAYVACNHLDFGHFVFSDPDRVSKSEDLGRIPVNLSRAADRQLLTSCAMATGAFPVGLAARAVERDLNYIEDNPNINLDFPNKNSGHLTSPDTKVYTTVNVDGGLLNNEPFDRAEELFFKRYGGDKTREELRKADAMRYAILMIDPFPSEDFDEDALGEKDIEALLNIIKTFTPDENTLLLADQRLRTFLVDNRHLSPVQVADLVGVVAVTLPDLVKQVALSQQLIALNHKRSNPETHLKALIGPIFNTMRQQLMFKRGDIRAAFDTDDYSRFLIGPKRTRQARDAQNVEIEKKLSGSKAIACGSFSGFGGFVSKDFRNHDFYLGRLNCKRFLKHHFGVPVESLSGNDLLKNAYSAGAIKRYGYFDKDRKKQMVPIIPLLKNVPEADLPWPSIREDDIRGMKSDFKIRARGVIASLFHPKNWFLRQAIKFLSWAFDGKVADTVLDLIVENFRQHRLLTPTGDVSRDKPTNPVEPTSFEPPPTSRHPATGVGGLKTNRANSHGVGPVCFK